MSCNQGDHKLRTIVMRGKTYKYTGISPVWRSLAPNDTRLWDTKGRLVLSCYNSIEDERGDWIEIFSKSRL